MRKEVVCYGTLKSVFQTTGLPSGVMPSASTAITVFLLLLYRWMTASPLSSKITLGVSKACGGSLWHRAAASCCNPDYRTPCKGKIPWPHIFSLDKRDVLRRWAGAVVDDHIRLVGLTVFPASLFSRDVIGVDV